MFSNAGHLVGAAAIHLKVNEDGKETGITFSGDVGRSRHLLLQSPAEFPQADHIILESTYGDRHHDISFNNIETLLTWVKKTCIDKKGKLIIPAFSVGRTQEVLYTFNQLELEKRLPELNYYVDSPLSMKATETIKKYTDNFNDHLQEILKIDDDPFVFKGLKYIETVEDSKRLTQYNEPCVIISASGTADAGRVRHHISSCIGGQNHTILLVGYCGVESLGGRLISGAKEVELFGDACAVVAEVGQMGGMSAHGDCDDLCNFINCQDAEKVKTVFLVHGEYTVQQALAARLERKGFKKTEVPVQHQQFELD
jgi:metallo-beta-lactamase family protein